MRNIIATIAVLLSVCSNAQYKEMLHAYITPTNKVVTSVPDWVKSAADYYTFGFRKDGSLNGFLSFAHGTNVTASGKYSFASGSTTVASAEASHAEGNSTTASGYASHAEGCTTVAKGNCSHAEGRYTTANGTYSHSSGVSSLASNNYSFVWSGVLPPTNPNGPNNKYGSNGEGTFNINPIGGIEGFYIGETNLASIIKSSTVRKFNELAIERTDDEIILKPVINNSINFNMNFIEASTSGDAWNIVVSGTYYTLPNYDEYYVEMFLKEDENFLISYIGDYKWEVIIIAGSIPDSITGYYEGDIILARSILTCTGYDSPANGNPADNTAAIYLGGFSGSVNDITYNFFQRGIYGARNSAGKLLPILVDLPTGGGPISCAVTLNLGELQNENSIAWRGVSIIEKFTGASKAIPGLVTWNISEVAPGICLIDRAPMNNDSSSNVTIKGDNGNDYTLNIDENGVLEVRSK